MHTMNSFLLSISIISILFSVNDRFGFIFLFFINISVFLSKDCDVILFEYLFNI